MKKKNRIITVFGCGGDRDTGKRPKMAAVASQWSDVTIGTSDNPRTEKPEKILDDLEKGIDPKQTQYHRVVARRDAIKLALNLSQSGDLVLIAGKGHENYQTIGDQKYSFDDRLVASEEWERLISQRNVDTN